MNPTLAGFATFVLNVMGISPTYLPANSNYLNLAFNYAMSVVNSALQSVPTYDSTQPTIYCMAVYNLAADALINIAQDQPGQTYFANARTTFGLNSFTPGIVTGAGDEGTSDSLMVPDAFNQLTIANLQQLKTPYGRFYLSIAQSYGQLWGMS